MTRHRSSFKKELMIAVVAAAITGIIYVGYDMWTKRGIIDYSFSDFDRYPSRHISFAEDGTYLMNVFVKNRGQSDASIRATISIENGKLIGTDGILYDSLQDNLQAKKGESWRGYNFSVKPDPNSPLFTLSVSAVGDGYFSEASKELPVSITYEKAQFGYSLK